MAPEPRNAEVIVQVGHQYRGLRKPGFPEVKGSL
jgi:hypothetical protein